MQPDQASTQQLTGQLTRTEGYLQVDPGNTDLLAAAIDLCLALGDLARAQQHVDAACTRYPADPFFQYRRAHVLVGQQRWEAAMPIFAALFAQHQDGNIAYSLADCQWRAGACQEALDTMAAFRADPALAPEAVTLLVRVLHTLGQLDEAADLAQAHGARLGAEPAFLAAAGLMYFDRGDVAQATAMSEAALAAGKRAPEALVVSGSLALGRSDTDTAIARFNEVLAKNPREGRSWSGLGMASLLRRDLQGAAAQLEQAVKYMPSHLGTWHLLGWCRLFGNDLAGARAVFEAALERDRNFGESHGGLAVVQAMQGEREAAEAGIARALRLDPNGLSARYAQMVLSGEAADPERFKRIAYRLLSSHQALDGETIADVVQRHAGD